MEQEQGLPLSDVNCQGNKTNRLKFLIKREHHPEGKQRVALSLHSPFSWLNGKHRNQISVVYHIHIEAWITCFNFQLNFKKTKVFRKRFTTQVLYIRKNVKGFQYLQRRFWLYWLVLFSISPYTKILTAV